MKQLTANQPKCLLTVSNHTLLDYQLGALQSAGIQDIAIVTGYQHDKIPRKPFQQIFHNPYWSTTNMVYTLMQASEWLTKQPCIISYTDIIYQPAAVSLLLQCQYDLAITYSTQYLALWQSRFTNPLDDLENFTLDKQNRVTQIGGKANSLSHVNGQYMGLIKITPQSWQHIITYLNRLSHTIIANLDMTSLFAALLQHDSTLHAVSYDGSWAEIDSEKDLKLLRQSQLACYYPASLLT